MGLQQWQHIFYFSTWDESKAAKRVISWSSLDWDRSRWNQFDLVLGTSFDLMVHVANTYWLSCLLPLPGLVLGLLVTMALYQGVLNNSRFSWSSRYSAVPGWIARRVKPLTSEQETPSLGQKSCSPRTLHQ